nr:MAG TPA: hypothetical protein [Bacteriophage sp.]
MTQILTKVFFNTLVNIWFIDVCGGRFYLVHECRYSYHC